MINKNVYILYPAGYHGTYVKWAVECSDLDSRKNTVSNPINKNNTRQFGGIGTAHNNVKIPTHQNFEHHQRWVILNRPKNPKVYAINTTSECSIETISNLLFEDKTGIVILIHNNNDNAIESYGHINCVIKWPSYMYTLLRQFDSIVKIAGEFDAFNCANNREFRNFLVKNNVLGTQKKLDFENLQHVIDTNAKWYTCRNFCQPHEVNEETYISNITDIDKRIFQINCKDIPSTEFLNIFKNILQISDLSDNWSTEQLQNIHQEYIDVQPNLQWFDSLQNWEKTGQLDNYLISHSVIESKIILQILKKSNVHKYTYEDRARWLTFYTDVCGVDWPKTPSSEAEYYNLPKWIQDEITQHFQYQLICQGPPVETIQKLDWETMSLGDINKVFQDSQQ
jgi:hypothetical protein